MRQGRPYLAKLRARAVGIHDVPLVVDVAGVEELVEVVARLAAGDHVTARVIELS